MRERVHPARTWASTARRAFALQGDGAGYIRGRDNRGAQVDDGGRLQLGGQRRRPHVWRRRWAVAHPKQLNIPKHTQRKSSTTPTTPTALPAPGRAAP